MWTCHPCRAIVAVCSRLVQPWCFVCIQIQKYSQFINFPIYLWAEKTIKEEVPIEEEEEKKEEAAEEETDEEKDDEAEVRNY